MNCPHCSNEKVYILARDGRYCCANSSCRKQFSQHTNTALYRRKKSVAWYERIIALHQNGLNAHQIAVALGNPRNTYKSVWGFLKRLEAANGQETQQ